MVYTIVMNDKSSPPTATNRSVLDLAWGRGGGPRPGPKPSLALAEIVSAAVEIADSDGLDGLSMQRLAKRLGVTPMALYRYVDTKDDLVFLAADAAAGDPPSAPGRGESWRAATERFARGQLSTLSRHPWVARIPLGGPPLAPGQVAWMERGLECLTRAGLDPLGSLGALNLISGYVLGHFRLYQELAGADLARGTSRHEAELGYAELIQQLIDPARFPLVAAAFASAAAMPDGDPAADFEFGLARILDGLELMRPRR
jgi:AcrR family transcriptional regulator